MSLRPTTNVGIKRMGRLGVSAIILFVDSGPSSKEAEKVLEGARTSVTDKGFRLYKFDADKHSSARYCKVVPPYPTTIVLVDGIESQRMGGVPSIGRLLEDAGALREHEKTYPLEALTKTRVGVGETIAFIRANP